MEEDLIRFKFSNAVRSNNLKTAKLYISDINKNYLSLIFINLLSSPNYLLSDDAYDIIKFLLENGADPNIGDSLRHYKTALHYINFSAMNEKRNDNYIKKSIEMSILLLDFGANPNQTCLVINKPTPWSQLFWCKDKKLIKKYLEKGSDPKYFINCHTNFPDIYRSESYLYSFSKNYLEKIETKKKAEEKIRHLVVKKLYHRVGGINLDEYF
jgi:hypothetical protein